MLKKILYVVSLVLVTMFIFAEDNFVTGEHSIKNLKKNITREKLQIKKHRVISTNFQYALIAAENTVSLVGKMMLHANESNVEFHDIIYNETNGQLRYAWLRPSIIQLSGSIWKFLNSVQYNVSRMTAIYPQIERYAEESLRILTSGDAETVKELIPIYQQRMMDEVKICINLANSINNLFWPTMELLHDIHLAVLATVSFAQRKISQLQSDGYNTDVDKELSIPNKKAISNVQISGSSSANYTDKADRKMNIPMSVREKSGKFVNMDSTQALKEINKWKFIKITIKNMSMLLQETTKKLHILGNFLTLFIANNVIMLQSEFSSFNAYVNLTALLIQNDEPSIIIRSKNILQKEINRISIVCMSLRLVAETYVNVFDSSIVCPANDFLCHHRNLTANEGHAITNDENTIRIAKNIEEMVLDAKAVFLRYARTKQAELKKLLTEKDAKIYDDLHIFGDYLD